MQKLICEKDIQNLHARGEQIVYVDSKTIITPSARDAAESLGIKFTEEMQATQEGSPALFEGMDNEKIYKVLKILMERGTLAGLLKPYQATVHDSGFKVVRGDTVQMDVLETPQADSKAKYQEIINEGEMRAGFLTIEDSKFDWVIECEEINYVIAGSVSITIDGTVFQAKQGDALYFPKGAKVIWEASGMAKLFYTTYPGNGQ